MTPDGIKRLKLDEGLRLTLYNDVTGQDIEQNDLNCNPSIGYGRNLIARGISIAEADFLLANDIADIQGRLAASYPWATTIPPIWHDIMVMIEYNTGDIASWPRLLGYAQHGAPGGVHDEIIHSLAYIGAQHKRYARFAAAVKVNAWVF